MRHPIDAPRCVATSDDHVDPVRQLVRSASSSIRQAVLIRRVVLALLIPLLIGLAPAMAQTATLTGVKAARYAMVPNGKFISGWGAPRGTRTHQGEDLAAPRGSPIYAPARLTITSTSWNTLGGWTVMGRDSKGRRWYFAHMNSRSRLSVGSTIYKGRVMGYVGTTGSSGGTPHLHYQVTYPGGSYGNPVYVLQNYPDVP